MAKTTDKKLALKRETLRSLSDDHLRAVAGGSYSAYDPNQVGAGGVRGTTTSPPPTGETLSGIIIRNYNYYP